MRRLSLFNAALADRGDRIAGFPVRRCVARAADATAPGEGSSSRLPPGAVILADPVLVLAGAVAAYERCDLARAVEIALCAHAERIGCGVLARAVADAAETDTPESSVAGGGAGRVMPCPAEARDDGEDLYAVPEFRRIGANRFRGGVP